MVLDQIRSLRRRVVVTGCGVVTPLGCSVDTFWNEMLLSHSGIGPITAFDTAELPVRIAGEVRDFDASAFMPRPVSRRLDHFAQYAVAAAVQAADQAQLSLRGEAEAERVAVIVGTGYGSHRWLMDTTLTTQRKGPRSVSPYFAVTIGPDAGAVEIGLRFGAKGQSGARSTACATGTTCIGDATRLIQHGEADIAFAGAGEDVVTFVDMAATARSGALSQRNDEPTLASRPFDRDRDGFVMGSGAGVLVLEEAGHAMARGAPILAEVAGYGAATESYHLTAPDPEGSGARRAITLALADAGVEPGEVDYVNAHGTSTKLNDAVETAALRAVLGKTATTIPISSTKSMIGHLMGAAGAVEAVAAIQAIRTGTVPPTINCDHPEDPELNYVAHRPQQWPTRVAISNSFGFGGHCAVLVFRRWDG